MYMQCAEMLRYCLKWWGCYVPVSHDRCHGLCSCVKICPFHFRFGEPYAHYVIQKNLSSLTRPKTRYDHIRHLSCLEMGQHCHIVGNLNRPLVWFPPMTHFCQSLSLKIWESSPCRPQRYSILFQCHEESKEVQAVCFGWGSGFGIWLWGQLVIMNVDVNVQ